MAASVRAIRAALLACVALAVAAAPADAARPATKAERAELLRAAAGSAAGEQVGLRLGRGGATMAPLTLQTPATIGAWRSSVDPRWALLHALPRGAPSAWRAFALSRSGGRWRVRFAFDRGEIAETLCRRASPSIAVALDLGLSTGGGPSRCRHPREPNRIVRRMTAAELASVRAMVEWHFDEQTGAMVPGPVQPRVHDVFASDCAWDGRGDKLAPAWGVVARADPRWGAVSVACVIGSDGFALIETTTVMLVSRAGRAGAFTAVPGHTMPSWSSYGSLCGRDQRWPVPAAARVALEYCTPFPAALRDALR